MKRTKTKLVSSIVTLLVCFAMLVGSTFAWFTDSASTGVNKIQAGNLDIEVEYKKPDDSWASIQDATSLFSSNLWEPGHTEYVTLKVENKGTLSLKYKILVTPVSESGGINIDNQSFKLSDSLVFGTTDKSDVVPSYTRETARAAVTTTYGLADINALTKEYDMEKGANPQYITLVVYMPETVGNVANYKTGTAAPTIDLGIKVVATQLENENDSFSSDYDAGAKEDQFYAGVGAYYDYFEAINITQNADSNGNFNIVKQDANTGVIASASGTATAGSEVNMMVMKSSDAEKNFTVTVEDGHELNGYEIKVTGQTSGSLVQGSLYVGTGLENFKFYHDGNLMNEVTYNNEMSLTDGQFSYNPANGYVYFATSTFSPFQATYVAPVASIGTAVYGTVVDAFAAVKDGETIVLLKDSVGNGIKVSKGKNFTVDFNNFTYDVNGDLVGSSGTETNSLQLLKDSTIIFKNGKLTSTQNRYTSQILIQNYSNLTLDNMTVSAGIPFDYILSNNNGNVIIRNTTITAAEGKVAFDVCRYSSYTGPSVTVEGNSVINGNVEISSSGSKEDAVHQLNVTGGTFNGNIYKYGDSPDFVGNITGGIFAYDPNKFVADGYCALKDGNRYFITEGIIVSNRNEFVTGVNGTYETIYLGESFNVESTVIINRDVKIYGLGNTLTAYSNPVIKITGNVDVVFKDFNINFPSYTGREGIQAVGTVKKLSFDGVNINNAFKAIHFNSCNNTDVVIKNCNFTSLYPFNVNGGNVGSFVVENSSLNGWTSFSNSTNTTYLFKDCSFGEGLGYATVKPYGSTDFENCTFSYDYFEDLEGGIASGTVTPITIKFNNCFMITSEGNKEELTVDLLKEAFNYDITSGSSSGESTINSQYWYVNGEQVAFNS